MQQPGLPSASCCKALARSGMTMTTFALSVVPALAAAAFVRQPTAVRLNPGISDSPTWRTNHEAVNCGSKTDVNEFSRVVGVAGLGRKATRHALVATDDECTALAGRFGFDALASFKANVSLAVVDKRRMRVRAFGKFDASDVVMDGPLGGSVTLQATGVAFETFFAEDLMAAAGKYDSDEDEAYDEEIDDGLIDIGELVAQHMYLHFCEMEMTGLREFEPEFEDGEVVFDSDQDE